MVPGSTIGCALSWVLHARGRFPLPAIRHPLGCRWCQGKGLRGAALPARFPTAAGPLRGVMAGGHVAAGDVVLEVPQDLLISYDTAKSSDLVRARWGGVDPMAGWLVE